MTGADLTALLKKQPFASVCVLVALVAAVLLYVRSDAVEEARTAFEAREQEAQKMEINVRNLVGLEEQTQGLQEAARQLDARLIRANQLANNLQIFYRLEAETNVKLMDIRQGAIPPLRPGTQRGIYSPIPFTMTVQGTYAAVHTFVRRLEASPHFTRFNQITFTKADAGRSASGGGSMTVTMTIEMLGTP